MENQRKPRKLKKALKKAVITIDINSYPVHLFEDPSQWIEYFKETGILFYDSDNGGQEPQILPIKGMKNVKSIKVK